MNSKHITYIKENLKKYQSLKKNHQTNKLELKLSRRDSVEKAMQRLDLANASQTTKDLLLSRQNQQHFDQYRANIENYIGAVSVPLGLAGPLTIEGSYANGEYYIPMATTEAALIASYNRGLKAIKESGGCRALVLAHEVQRSPFFKFNTLIEAAKFVSWIDDHKQDLKAQAEKTTNHGKLKDITYQIESNLVVLCFCYSTGAAAGQNMVTFATEKAYHYILKYSPIKPIYHALEANVSGDKKLSFQSMLNARGYKVTVECLIPRSVLSQILAVDIDQYEHYIKSMYECASLSLNINFQAHFANSLTAMFLACGQDVACIAEAATGLSKIYRFDQDAMYWSVTLPNIIVGTVGGGTTLPHQRASLELLDLKSLTNTAAEFAEICAATCLAGEISLTAAICSGQFSKAHKTLARSRQSLSTTK